MPPPSSPPGDKSSDDRVGTVLSDRYRLDSLLGEGGMGRVYAAEHVMMRKKLAVKILHRELTTVPEVVKRFEREAMAAANIDDPNVAAATDFGKLADGSVFMAMEFVEGRSLRDEIAAGPLRCERALRIGRQIGSALASAHALDIVHRDLKPENVMLVTKGTESDFVKVLDFGIAKVPIGELGPSGGGPITKVGMVFGTPEYMAPEQALGQPVDGRADLYALGVILYEMLAGVRPFSSSSQTGILGQQLSRPAPPFVERAPGVGVPPAIEQVVLKLLQREASDRFQQPAQVVAAIEALMGAGPGDAPLFTQLGGSAPRSLSGAGSIPDVEGSASSVHLGSNPNGLEASMAADATTRPASFPELEEVSQVPFPAAPGALPGIGGAGAPIGPTGGTLVAGSVRSAMGSRPHLGAEVPSLSVPLPAWVPPPVVDFVDRVDRWRQGLPDPMNRVPALGYLGGALALALGGVLLGIITLLLLLPRGKPDQPLVTPSASTSIQPDVLPAVEGASSAELGSAQKSGSKALQQLAKRYPRDAAVLVALARAQRDAQQHAGAVDTIERALELAPELRQDADVASILWVTVQDAATREATFDLLEGPMGSRGAEIAYDLIVTPKISAAARQRAEQFVDSPRFEQIADPEVGIAVKLRDARKCEDVHALLDEVVELGDSRSLPYLRRFQNTKSCKVRRRRVDCWPCLRGDGKLIAAIEAAAARPADAKRAE